MPRARHWGTVRIRLMILALLPILVLTPVLLGITMQRWLARTDQILSARVGSDLTVGREYLSHLVETTRDGIAAYGRSAAFQSLPAAARGPALGDEARRLGLDFLLLADGDTLPRHLGPAVPRHGIVVLEPHELAQLAADLPDRARLALANSPAEPETRGMVVLAAVPLDLPADGTLLLVGGILMNGNTAFIDRINDLVYPATNPTRPGNANEQMDLGITTLFLDDIRIATTLRPTGAARALGTRASAEVTAQVLGDGLPWRGTAFVVNDWYISAYEPLLDIHGARIGMLYAGIPQAPYTAARRVTFLMIGAAFALVVALFIPLFLHWARGIFRPVEGMGATIARVEQGNLAARTGPTAGAPELTQLAAQLDQLLTQLEQRDSALQSLNRDLNSRVEARTADLLQANQALEAATRRLVLSAKLATIGEVTAGVAHEINNPLAVISGNLEVLRMVLAERQSEAGAELQLIEEQIGRIGALVNQLLQLARPEEFTGQLWVTDMAEVLARVRPLVRHLLADGNVRLDWHNDASRSVAISPHEMQQVLINLIGNAVQALPQGGTIELNCQDATSRDGRPGVRLTVRDNGKGMEARVLDRIFDPFFTTRGGSGGTGLGLSICQSLITRAAGDIRVSSTPGHGTMVDIWLPEGHPPPE